MESNTVDANSVDYFCGDDAILKKDMEVQRIKTLEAIENPECGYYFETSVNHYFNIPGIPLACWVSDKFVNAFANEQMNNGSCY